MSYHRRLNWYQKKLSQQKKFKFTIVLKRNPLPFIFANIYFNYFVMLAYLLLVREIIAFNWWCNTSNDTKLIVSKTFPLRIYHPLGKSKSIRAEENLRHCDDFIKNSDSEVDSSSFGYFTPRLVSKSTLVVYTTCNHLDMTIKTIDYLLMTLAKGDGEGLDIVIVDDHSVDGTAEYLERKGFLVLAKSSPKGLTHSWNLGYEFATRWGYSTIIFMNNDVLVPRGAITKVLAEIKQHALVVPLTSHAGRGHTPTQVTSPNI